jgi:hypothetical protein
MPTYDDSEFDYEGVLELIRSTHPSCINDFGRRRTESPIAWTHAVALTAWQLSCRCGATAANFLGYPLSQYNRNYRGTAFVSPLSIRCSTCSSVTNLLDTARHGYHAEIGSRSATIRGSGDPLSFPCAHCAGQLFEPTVVFLYWNLDLIEDEPHLIPRAADFFNEFVAFGKCTECGEMERFTDFGKL